jgi:hypothetical protein
MQAASATLKPFPLTLLTFTRFVGPTVSMWCAHMVNVSAILTIVTDAFAIARRWHVGNGGSFGATNVNGISIYRLYVYSQRDKKLAISQNQWHCDSHTRDT